MKGVESTSTVQSARLRVDTTIVVMSVGLSPRVTTGPGTPARVVTRLGRSERVAPLLMAVARSMPPTSPQVAQRKRAFKE